MTTMLRRLGYTYGRWNRHQKSRFAQRFIADRGISTILIVGASPTRNEVDGIVERSLVRAAEDVAISGLAPDIPEWPNYTQADGLDLPFGADEFDLVYSNAMIEHVGGAREQHRFLIEHERVGRHWITTTPNRWFPVEAHTHTLFRHWSPSWVDERGSVTRLLSPRDLQALLPRGRVIGTVSSPTLAAISG